MLEVASRLCGLHAQLMSSAELSVWARIADLPRDAVQRSLWEDRTIFKTWAMRGTLHLLPSDELPMWRAALATSSRYLGAQAWQNYFGITLEDLDRITAAIGTVLRGSVLTREELAHEVARLPECTSLGTKLAESSWGTILKPAAFTGQLCFGPSSGQRVRFTHPASWLSVGMKPISPEAATAEITRRFLSAYGPASPHDLARWWGGGSSVGTARKWITALGQEITPVDLEGRHCWILTQHLADLRNARAERSVRLLPGFDQYVVGASHHAEQVIRGGSRSQIFRPQGWISPVFLLNGFIQGVWKLTFAGTRGQVLIETFGRVPVWARRLTAEEVERLGTFLGCSLKLVWS